MRRTPRHSIRLAAAVATVAALTGVAPATAAPAPPAAARPAAATPPTLVTETADERIARVLRGRVTTARFGSAISFYVADAASGRRIWSTGATRALMPASTTKLVTAHNALMTFGSRRQFSTFVKQGARTNWVIIQGLGDPSLSSSQLRAMARTVATTLRSRGVSVARVYVDDDRFPRPTLAHGWKASYVPDAITPVRALVRDQVDSSDTSADVARYFAHRLEDYGIPNAVYKGRTNAPTSAKKLASSQGRPLSDIVRRMMIYSDNEIAESLHKMVAYERGKSTSWTGARSAQADVMWGNHLPFSALYDGSGLSRSDRLTSEQLVTLLLRGNDTSYSQLWPLRSTNGLSTAGVRGTLDTKYHRFTTSQSKCAVGKVWAKTGTLGDVVSMAGFTYGADGRKKIFAFVVNGKRSTTSLKQGLDMLAASVNGCY